MRFGLIFLVLLFALFGAAFGALNGQPIDLDLYFATITLAKGGALLGALLLGWLLGGILVFFSLVIPLRARLRRAERARRERRGAADAAADPTPADVVRQ